MYILVFIPSSRPEALKPFSFSFLMVPKSLFVTSICPNPSLAPGPLQIISIC